MAGPIAPSEYGAGPDDAELEAEGRAAGLRVWGPVTKAYELFVGEGALANSQLWSLREAIRAEHTAENADRRRQALHTSDRHPATVGLLRWFAFQHLPPRLAEVSAVFSDLAEQLVADLPDGPELTTALRKLLESKDAAVRARIEQLDQQRAGEG